MHNLEKRGTLDHHSRDQRNPQDHQVIFTCHYYFNVSYILLREIILLIDIHLLYGRKHTLHCGDSDPNTPPGDWFHNGAPIDRYNRSYTIANATFSDDGEYQCRRNGGYVLSSPLQVHVYGKIYCKSNMCTLSML